MLFELFVWYWRLLVEKIVKISWSPLKLVPKPRICIQLVLIKGPGGSSHFDTSNPKVFRMLTKKMHKLHQPDQHLCHSLDHCFYFYHRRSTVREPTSKRNLCLQYQVRGLCYRGWIRESIELPPNFLSMTHLFSVTCRWAKNLLNLYNFLSTTRLSRKT